MKPITIDEIDYTVPYEGYVWYSGQQSPEIINGLFDKSYFDPFTRNIKDSLFIIEGNLYAHTIEHSISIRFVDGEYLIHQAVLTNIDPEQITTERYKSRRLNDKQYMEMAQYWDEVEDELLEGMKTLVPAWTAFVGFVK